MTRLWSLCFHYMWNQVFRKRCWYPQHNDNIDNYIEFGDVAKNMVAKSLFSGNFAGKSLCWGLVNTVQVLNVLLRDQKLHYGTRYLEAKSQKMDSSGCIWLKQHVYQMWTLYFVQMKSYRHYLSLRTSTQTDRQTDLKFYSPSPSVWGQYYDWLKLLYSI